MQKINKEVFIEMKQKSIDYVFKPNVWYFHMPDNKFYCVRHSATQYYVSKGTKHFSDVLVSYGVDRIERNLSSSTGW